jgi:hypothetical protein
MVSIRKFNDFLIKESSEEVEVNVKRKIDQIELKLKKLFTSDTIEGGEIQKFGQSEKEPDKKSEIFRNLNLESLEQAKFSKTYKSVKLIFSDDEYRYDVTFSINLKDAVPTEGQEFDPETLTECNVEFKRYSLENGTELFGEFEKKVPIDDISETLFEELLLEVEKNYPTVETDEEEFSIETE